MKQFTTPEPATSGAPLLPLAGVRILELGADPSVAFGARLLCDLGAEVIKVEAPGGGDPLRRAAPYLPGEDYLADSALFAYLNHGKRSVSVDIATPSGARILRDLSAQCGLILAEASHFALALNDPLDDTAWPDRPPTVLSSPFGAVGQEAARPSTPFVLQHASSFAFHQASPVADPEAKAPVGCADWEGSLAPGLVIAIAALWALSTGEAPRPGPLVDLSKQDVLTYILVEPFADWQMGLDVSIRQRDPSKGLTIAGGLVWYLPCADGAVMVSPREDHQWHRWMEVMGNPEWSNDKSLCGDRVVRTAKAAALQQKMAEWSCGENKADVVARAQAARVACFPVSTPIDLLNNEQLASRQFFSTLKLDNGQSIQVPGLPFRFVSESGREMARGGTIRSPRLGADNADILVSSLGLVSSDIDHLKASRVI